MESPNNAFFGCQNKILGREPYTTTIGLEAKPKFFVVIVVEPYNKKNRSRSCLLDTRDN